eukprot:TRINITY_DN100426_c0_g1_i1.p1 TRINITY_DN100426_c0_g1~~TRINITY_DN100426_c0_g1_i1.p1  ORF type:complete len:2227 (-),score=690.33 TRINITY_DN100426_c0_g1_i1:127-6807(-)
MSDLVALVSDVISGGRLAAIDDLSALVSDAERDGRTLENIDEMWEAAARDGGGGSSKRSTSLMQAVQAQNMDLVSLLVRGRANLEAGDKRGVRPLHMAVYSGSSEMVKLLIDAGAEIDARDRHGQTPLFFAPTEDACRQLHEAKAAVHLLNHKGQSALHLAAHAGLENAVAYLATQVPPEILNAQDSCGRTALYMAARWNLPSIMAHLQERGADASIRPPSHKFKPQDGGATSPSRRRGKRRAQPTHAIEVLEHAERTRAALERAREAPTLETLRELKEVHRKWQELEAVVPEGGQTVPKECLGGLKQPPPPPAFPLEACRPLYIAKVAFEESDKKRLAEAKVRREAEEAASEEAAKQAEEAAEAVLRAEKEAVGAAAAIKKAEEAAQAAARRAAEASTEAEREEAERLLQEAAAAKARAEGEAQQARDAQSQADKEVTEADEARAKAAREAGEGEKRRQEEEQEAARKREQLDAQQEEKQKEPKKVYKHVPAKKRAKEAALKQEMASAARRRAEEEARQAAQKLQSCLEEEKTARERREKAEAEGRAEDADLHRKEEARAAARAEDYARGKSEAEDAAAEHAKEEGEAAEAQKKAAAALKKIARKSKGKIEDGKTDTETDATDTPAEKKEVKKPRPRRLLTSYGYAPGKRQADEYLEVMACDSTDEEVDGILTVGQAQADPQPCLVPDGPPVDRDRWTRLLLVSSRMEGRQLLLRCVRNDVAVVVYDWVRADLDSLLADCRKALGEGARVPSIALITHGRPGAVGVTKGFRTTRDSLQRMERLRRFWGSLTSNFLETEGAIDLIGSRTGADEEGDKLIGTLKALTGFDFNCTSKPFQLVRDGLAAGKDYFDAERINRWVDMSDIRDDGFEAGQEILEEVPDIKKIEVAYAIGAAVGDGSRKASKRSFEAADAAIRVAELLELDLWSIAKAAGVAAGRAAVMPSMSESKVEAAKGAARALKELGFASHIEEAAAYYAAHEAADELGGKDIFEGQVVEVVDTIYSNNAEEDNEIAVGSIGVIQAIYQDGDAVVDFGYPLGKHWVENEDLMERIVTHGKAVTTTETMTSKNAGPTFEIQPGHSGTVLGYYYDGDAVVDFGHALGTHWVDHADLGKMECLGKVSCEAVAFELHLEEHSMDTFGTKRKQALAEELSEKLGCDFVDIVAMRGGSVILPCSAFGLSDEAARQEACSKIKSDGLVNQELWGRSKVLGEPKVTMMVPDMRNFIQRAKDTYSYKMHPKEASLLAMKEAMEAGQLLEDVVKAATHAAAQAAVAMGLSVREAATEALEAVANAGGSPEQATEALMDASSLSAHECGMTVKETAQAAKVLTLDNGGTEADAVHMAALAVGQLQGMQGVTEEEAELNTLEVVSTWEVEVEPDVLKQAARASGKRVRFQNEEETRRRKKASADHRADQMFKAQRRQHRKQEEEERRKAELENFLRRSGTAIADEIDINELKTTLKNKTGYIYNQEEIDEMAMLLRQPDGTGGRSGNKRQLGHGYSLAPWVDEVIRSRMAVHFPARRQDQDILAYDMVYGQTIMQAATSMGFTQKEFESKWRPVQFDDTPVDNPYDIGPLVERAVNSYQPFVLILESQEAQAPLPSGWESAIDPDTGNIYYYNHATRKTQWEPPSEVYEVLPPGWGSAMDPESGLTYYYNLATEETQWDFPEGPAPLVSAVEKQYEAECEAAFMENERLIKENEDLRKELEEILQRTVVADTFKPTINSDDLLGDTGNFDMAAVFSPLNSTGFTTANWHESEAQPIEKQIVDGCLRFQVVLEKTDPSQKFGFTHKSGRIEYLKAAQGLQEQLSPTAPTLGTLEAAQVAAAAAERRAEAIALAAAAAASVPGSVPAGADGGGAADGDNMDAAEVTITTIIVPGSADHSLLHTAGWIDGGPEVLVVRKIHASGMLDAWNNAHPEAEVCLGDVLEAVNESETIKSMQRELRGDKVRLDVVRYPEVFNIELSKDTFSAVSSTKLGFKFRRPANTKLRELRVVEIANDGLLPEWNRLQASQGRYHMVVLPGMRIQAANEVDGDIDGMVQVLRHKVGGKVCLRIRRATAEAARREERRTLAESAAGGGNQAAASSAGFAASSVGFAASSAGFAATTDTLYSAGTVGSAASSGGFASAAVETNRSLAATLSPSKAWESAAGETLRKGLVEMSFEHGDTVGGALEKLAEVEEGEASEHWAVRRDGYTQVPGRTFGDAASRLGVPLRPEALNLTEVEALT